MDLMQAPQKKTRPPPQRHVGMNRVSTQWPFLGLASARLPSAGESWRVFACRFHSCRHQTLLLVAPASLRAAGNIQYTVILARTRDCVRLLSTLRADATGKKETANP